MKNRTLIFLIVSLLFGLSLHAQNDFSLLLNKRLNEYLLNNIQEKIYVQTNSNQYSPGDTIWFKASLLNAITHTPFRTENLLYVDLISPDKQVAYHHLFRVFNGFSAGYIPVDTEYKYGTYQLVAYTNYMKNFSSEFFFKKQVNILRIANDLVSWKFQPDLKTYDGGDSLFLTLRANSEDGAEINANAKVLFEVGEKLQHEQSTVISGNFGIFKTFIPDTLFDSEATITVSLPFQNNSIGRFEVVLPGAKPDLQFLPESGNLIPGISNTVAFKCLDVNGKALDVSGIIYSNGDTQVGKFKTEHQGMGSFILAVEAGISYTAEILWKGVKLSYNLPTVNERAYGLHLVNESIDSLYFSIEKSTDQLEKLMILGHTRGISHFFTSGGIGQKTTKLTVAKNNFPTGITVFTLFAKNYPQAERLVYIEHNDQLIVHLETNEQQIGKRDKVELEVEITDQTGTPVMGSFSLNAFDTFKEQSVDFNDNIQNYLLCSSELNGAVLQDGNFFDRQNPTYARNIDLLMLTNGWRRFTWTEIYSNIDREKDFALEKGLKLHGEVRRAITNKPVPKNIEVSITMTRHLPVYHDQTVTDEFGQFSFDLPDFTDSASFIIQTKNRLNQNIDYIIELHSNLEHKKLDQFTFDKIADFALEPIVTTHQNFDGSTNIVVQKSILREARVDNYYFPGIDTFLIEEVEVHSNFLSQRDSLIHRTGEPDVILEAAQVKKLVEKRDWYSSIWDLLRDQIPGLLIMQRPYDTQLASTSNLVIRGEPESIFFKVPDNSGGFLHIIVDGDFLGRGAVKMYDYLSYMDPAEIESVNFIARPKKYDAPGFDDFYEPQTDIVQDVDPYESYDLMFQPGAGAIDATNNFMDTLTKMASPPSYLFITTKSKRGIYNQKTPGMAELYLQGFSDYKEFYSPKYATNEAKKLTTTDKRKTLFWEPNVITDSTGRTKVSFYTSDSDSPIALFVQGVSVNGLTGVAHTIINENSNNRPLNNELAESKSVVTDDYDYKGLNLIKGVIFDAESKLPLSAGNLTLSNPYYQVSCNNEGGFIVDKKKWTDGKAFVVSCPGYLSQTINKAQLEQNKNCIELIKAPVQNLSTQKSAIEIVKSSIRKSWGYYDSDKVYQGYYREAIAVNKNYYGVYESGFNYSNKLRAGIARSLLYETDKFKNMEDKNGHKLLILKPNHRSIYYPLKNDVLSFSPAFWDFSQLNEFNYEVVGEVDFGGQVCYKITFDMKDEVILPLEKGLLYIDKESFALRSAQWETSPKNREFHSYTRYLQSNPMEYQLNVISNKNQVNYAYENGKLILQSTRGVMEILVNKHDVLTFENQLSVLGESYKQAKFIENSTPDLLIEQGDAKNYLIKDAQYQIEPWVNFGMIKPESYLIRDAGYMHDVTLFR